MEKHKISELTSFSDRMKEFDENAKSFKVSIYVKLAIANGLTSMLLRILLNIYIFLYMYLF